MSYRPATTSTPVAQGRPCVVVCPVPAAMEAIVGTHPAIVGKRGQNEDSGPGGSML